MRRYRVPLFFVGVLVLWLIFGSQIINVVTTFLSRPEGLPAGLNLEGKLFYTQGFDGIWQFDMRTGEASQWWQPPDGGLAIGIAASPDGSKLAIAYAPPAKEGFQIGTTDLFVSPSDQPNLQPLLVRENSNESYRQPSWSSDGAWLYYAHQIPTLNDGGQVMSLALTGERIAMGDSASQTPEVVLDRAEQLAVSPDGQKLAYLQLNTKTYAEGLWVVNHDGSDEREIVPAGTYSVIAAPKFTPDGGSVVFTATGAMTGQTISQNAGGVEIARAHGTPSDVVQISLDDGEITKLTQTPLDNPRIAWSPDGADMSILSAEGVFLVHEGRFHRMLAVSNEGEITWAR